MARQPVRRDSGGLQRNTVLHGVECLAIPDGEEDGVPAPEHPDHQLGHRPAGAVLSAGRPLPPQSAANSVAAQLALGNTDL